MTRTIDSASDIIRRILKAAAQVNGGIRDVVTAAGKSVQNMPHFGAALHH
jgi:negative regulator of replication initiation